jgi:RHS repeat-associated protein
MVTSITPIIQLNTPRAQFRVGDRSAYVTLEPDAYLDSTTSATQLATPTNQLSAIDYANAPDQSFTYDLNGNRTGSGNVTGADNRLTSNATWDFVYDANGNMTRRTLKSDNSYIEYTYDHRDRLTDVRYRNSAGTLTKRVHFGYDALNRRYLQTVENGSGTVLSTVYYVNQGFRKDRGDAGDEIALRLDGAGAVISRYLHGSLVDEVLAEENIGSGGVRDVLWAMTDHQGSVRDLARVTAGTASVVNHIVYDAFGKTVSETDAAIAHLYGFTGRELDKETGLQYNRARYLDLVLARWISHDPIGFAGGDANLYRYVVNKATYATDPSGLMDIVLTVSELSQGNYYAAIGLLPIVSVGGIKLVDEFGNIKYLNNAEARRAIAAAQNDYLGVVRQIIDDAPRSGEWVSDAMKGFRNGEIIPDSVLKRLSSRLRNNTRIIKNEWAQEILDKTGDGAQFMRFKDGSAAILLRPNATRYQLVHELKHYEHWLADPVKYAKMGKLEREEFVFKALQESNHWRLFTDAERSHALELIKYYRKLYGN